MSKRYGKFGKFTFTAHASGSHLLCFKTNSTRFSVFARENLVRNADRKKCYSAHKKIKPGIPNLCTGKHYFATQKLHLDVQMGEHTIGHSADRTKDSMQSLENTLSHLTEQMIHIARHQEFQRVNKCFTALP